MMINTNKEKVKNNSQPLTITTVLKKNQINSVLPFRERSNCGLLNPKQTPPACGSKSSSSYFKNSFKAPLHNVVISPPTNSRQIQPQSTLLLTNSQETTSTTKNSNMLRKSSAPLKVGNQLAKTVKNYKASFKNVGNGTNHLASGEPVPPPTLNN